MKRKKLDLKNKYVQERLKENPIIKKKDFDDAIIGGLTPQQTSQKQPL